MKHLFKLFPHLGLARECKPYFGRVFKAPLNCKRYLSSNEIATALRPFYFAVHPDLFGQYPREREVNENSLKQLMSYLESIHQKRPPKPTKIIFYLRSVSTLDVSESPHLPKDNFQEVAINLKEANLRKTIYHILKSCKLPTKYVDNLKETEAKKQPDRPLFWRQSFYHVAKRGLGIDEEFLFKDKPIETLCNWLQKHHEEAALKLESSKPIREETQRLKGKLLKLLKLHDIIWACGWSMTHFRGCLQSFLSLCEQHQESMHTLSGRILVFGTTTGINLDGHVVLSSEDVRNKWLEVIQNVPKYDVTLMRIPAVQKTVCRVLRDIQVVHRKFRPPVLAQSYEYQLRKLSAALADYWVKHNFPTIWPESLKEFELVVESDTGPLMLSPTGQFIVSSSCPAFLIVKFLTDNMEEASKKLHEYAENKYLERELHKRCVQELKLASLQKDDNITPDKMIEFCSHLLNYQLDVGKFVQGHHIYVSHYFSILQDGEMCIPWDCK